MNRLAFAFLVTLAFLAAPVAAQAQQPSKVPRVGVIGEASATVPFLAAFRQGLLGDPVEHPAGSLLMRDSRRVLP